MLSMTVVLPRPFAPAMAIRSAPFGQALEIQREDIETKAVANAAEALEGEHERLHGKPKKRRSDQTLTDSGLLKSIIAEIGDIKLRVVSIRD